MDLQGKRVLITGGAGGIGEAAARAFLRAGASVALVDIDAARLAEVTGQLNAAPGQVISRVADLTDDEQLVAVGQWIGEMWPAVDVLVNNAGICVGGRFLEQSPQQVRRAIEVNLYAPLRLVQLLVPAMVAQGRGHIVNVFSSSALLAIPGFAAYEAAKAGLVTFTRVLRRELAGTGVHLTALCPGPTITAMTEGSRAVGKGAGAQRYHGPDKPAAAIVAAVRRHRRMVIVSGQPVGQTVLNIVDRLFPNLLERMWIRMADADYYEAAARVGRRS